VIAIARISKIAESDNFQILLNPEIVAKTTSSQSSILAMLAILAIARLAYILRHTERSGLLPAASPR
jgi:hypothetical protein